MKNVRYPVLFLLILIIGISHEVLSQSITKEQWREDLRFLASSIREHHPNPFKHLSEDSFQNQIDSLHSVIPTLDDHEVIVKMASIVAQLKDGHTQLRGGLQFLTGQYPFGFIVCNDGIFVTKAPVALKEVLGRRLLRIGAVSAENVFERVASMTSYDNEQTLKNRVPSAMIIPEILHAFDITSERGKARFVFSDDNDGELIIDLEPSPFDAKISWISKPENEQLPLYLSHPRWNYWDKFLADEQVLYVQYNKVRDANHESIEEYFAGLTSKVDEKNPRKIILDVRQNGGGNGYLNPPVIDWVKSSLPKVNGQLYVIIGRGTYSAAQKLVTKLAASTEVIFVGEPTGSSPNHFGDARNFPLPNCEMTLRISSLYHQDAPNDQKESFEPSILVPLNSVDYFAGEDLVLKTILSSEED